MEKLLRHSCQHALHLRCKLQHTSQASWWWHRHLCWVGSRCDWFGYCCLFCDGNGVGNCRFKLIRAFQALGPLDLLEKHESLSSLASSPSADSTIQRQEVMEWDWGAPSKVMLAPKHYKGNAPSMKAPSELILHQQMELFVRVVLGGGITGNGVKGCAASIASSTACRCS